MWKRNCASCVSRKNSKEIRKKRGCYGPTEKPQFQPSCHVCDEKGYTLHYGEREPCYTCEGTGFIDVYTCPRKLGNDPFVSFLLQHFYVYKNSNFSTWPDGGTRLYQYRYLVEVFDYWTEQFYKYEKLRNEKTVENVNGNKTKNRT